jgi:D-sedoheptulose 7-phosphate isomerase
MIGNIEGIISEYFAKECKILESISTTEVAKLAHQIEAIRVSNATVFVAGNGGSASTASHFATDIGVGSLRRANPVRVISLCDNSAVMTALANDLDYSAIFEQQLRLLAKPGDLVIIISASGNSKNLLKLQECASELGVTPFSMTGFSGGKLRELTLGSNIHVQTPEGAYGMVEDIHLAICHVITECIRT